MTLALLSEETVSCFVECRQKDTTHICVLKGIESTVHVISLPEFGNAFLMIGTVYHTTCRLFTNTAKIDSV